ncbi:terminase gpA endonuclease subunit [Aquabacter sp. CN5-332]|uniref:terminase gpA endonuclease subunit n=1 Tax=Aquabacter sp. CN5-332 TaxID=3156608 RepID=UPI0032B5247B
MLVDGAKKGDLWSAVDAPYLIEPAACLSIEHPCNLVTIRKGQQTGASILALAWSLYLAEVAPDNMLYAVPGIDALQDINGQKLQPLIDAWQKKTDKRIIYSAVSRSGAGSTVYEKRFAGGYLSLSNANVAIDLSLRTCRYGVKDELSKWKETNTGDDPEVLFFGRFTAFRRQRSYKILEISTPELDSGDDLGDNPGHCRIDRSFRRSDQRFWNIRCPECRHEFVQCDDGLLIDRKHPHKSEYVCPDCGHLISEMERVAEVRTGRYIPTKEGPDRHPGFHIDAFMSLMMSYEAIANDKLEAEKRGEPGQKNYSNLVLALPHAMRGNAPDHQRLMERREKYPRGVIPPEGLIFVAGADVQHDGIWFIALAFAEDRQTWTVEATFVEGSTDDPNTGAWEKLSELHQRMWPDSYGGERRIEAMSVDAGDGNRTTQVIEWCRRHANTYAISGQPGRGVPAISQPANRSVKKNGKRPKAKGGKVWPVGTWSLKGEFYGNLHKVGLAGGAATDPPGYCHFGDWLGEEYFRQITAEWFEQKMIKGRFLEGWKKIRKDNHFLDCHVYAMAMAELLGLSRLTPAGWAALRRRHVVAPPLDLFASEAEKQVAAEAESSPDPAALEAPVVPPRVAPSVPPRSSGSRKRWGAYS